MDNNVINLFKDKISAIPKGESPEETVARFHAKLDEVLDGFQTFSIAEKFEVMNSVVELNKNLFKLYWDIKVRHDHTMNNY